MGTGTGVTQICVCARSIIIGPGIVEAGKNSENVVKYAEVPCWPLAFGADLSLFVLIGFWIVFSKLQTFSNRSIANVFCIPSIEVSHCFVHSNSESFNGLVCDMTVFFHVLPVWSDAISAQCTLNAFC